MIFFLRDVKRSRSQLRRRLAVAISEVDPLLLLSPGGSSRHTCKGVARGARVLAIGLLVRMFCVNECNASLISQSSQGSAKVHA
jgi:hypothetical protein